MLYNEQTNFIENVPIELIYIFLNNQENDGVNSF